MSRQKRVAKLELVLKLEDFQTTLLLQLTYP